MPRVASSKQARATHSAACHRPAVPAYTTHTPPTHDTTTRQTPATGGRQTNRTSSGAWREKFHRPRQNRTLQGKPSRKKGKRKNAPEGIRLPEPAVNRSRFSCSTCL